MDPVQHLHGEINHQRVKEEHSHHVEAAAFGDKGFAATLSPDALYIDMSTIAPATTDAIGARMTERGIAMVDAPVGRQQSHAVAGKLMIMVGGADEAGGLVILRFPAGAPPVRRTYMPLLLRRR